MPYPVAHIPIPQAGINIPFAQQAAYPLGLLLGGILPQLLGKNDKTNPQPQADNTTPQAASPQAVTGQSMPAPPTPAQPAQAANNQSPDLAAQLRQVVSGLGGAGAGGLGGLGGTATAAAPAAAPMGQPVQQQGFHIAPPSYAGTGPNAALLQQYSGMQPNVSGPSGMNPLQQLRQKLAMFNLSGGQPGQMMG